ncbi:MAG: ABC transporter permease [Candidatus Sericytochromatia bacterium]|uniref:ABC transporter permease n=1 Tax=Candidatus Tanganyikabacteria bacterium TaxID=2961651 RepID=A0A938BLX7_9BACT|nr:ABC transporter permease [Candidatus Tanganyikabacteria bacterium]
MAEATTLRLEGAPPGSDELPPPISSAQRVWRRFKKHKLAYGALWLLVFIYLLMAFADFFAPYGMASEDRTRSYQPPAAIHLRDDGGRWQLPFIYDRIQESDRSSLFSAGGSTDTTFGAWHEDKRKVYPLKLFVKGEPYKLFGLIETDRHFFGIESTQTRFYLLGGDSAGRDVFSRLFFGARVSLMVGLVALLVVIPIGTLVGGLAGYFGGRIDTCLMWLVETILAFPTIFLLITMAGVTAKWDITPMQRFVMITVILALLGWASLARVIRGMVLSIKAQEYVEAARAAGASDMWIIGRHLLPQTATWVIISATLSIPGYIYAESFLSLLGLGVQQPDASWGNMLEPARNVSDLILHPWVLAPGFAIVLTTVAWNFFGDGMRDAFDAKRRV